LRGEREVGAVGTYNTAMKLTGLPIDRRPDKSLLAWYAIGSLAFGPFFFIAIIPLYFRYHTLHYTFDEEGISMRWGILFRREISLTYARIQDIHLTSNFVERWLGLAKIQIQTASGSSSAEMVIEGLKDFEEIRDFLYTRMRGIKEGRTTKTTAGGVPAAGLEEVVHALRETAAELRALRAEMERRRS
jgi:putative membrane protein